MTEEEARDEVRTDRTDEGVWCTGLLRECAFETESESKDPLGPTLS